jgi:hypothetical protein
MVSAFWDHTGEAATSAAIVNSVVRMNFTIWILISPAL